jgi:hypothetical protein
MPITTYNIFNFIRLINSIACIPEYNLATLHGFNTFLLKIFRAQMGYKKGVMGANGFHQKKFDARFARI